MGKNKKIIFIILLLSQLIVLSCDPGSSSKSSSNSSISGSMARMIVVGDYLYTLTGNQLFVYSLKEPAEPTLKNKIKVNWDNETLFSMKNYLFIGSRQGMFIYSLENPALPVQVSGYEHIQSCDPVVAEGDTAYVTLRTGNSCRNGKNALEIIEIKDIMNPKKISEYPMKNPHGLAVDGKYLFICDGENGLRVYNVFDKINAKEIFQIENIGWTYDVIVRNKRVYVISNKGVYQYKYSNNLRYSQNELELKYISRIKFLDK